MQGSFKAGTVAGIEIRVHYTWLFAFALIAWSLADGYFPGWNNSFSARTDLFLGLVATLLFFGSLLIHELAHSLVARARGLRVDSITLFIFGGVSSISQEPTSPKEEFLVALVGPLASIVLAAIYRQIDRLAPAASAIAAVAEYLAFANLALGTFNLIPAYPLDGGRVLRSILWQVTGDEPRATRIASYVGQLFAFALIGWGVLGVIGGEISSGVWLVFIGWFLNGAAESARRHPAARRPAAGFSETSHDSPQIRL